jgi:4-carboxymuconolactone decarboxylase
MSERYRRGVDMVQQLSDGSIERFLKTSRIAEVAPDFARMVVEFAFGDLYSRDRIALRDREIVAIASLATLGKAVPQLRTHVEAAQRLGLGKAEIVEILMQTGIYSGLPAALNALADCHDLLAEGDCLACRSCHS